MEIEIALEEIEEAVAFGCSSSPTIVCDTSGYECGPGVETSCST
jgi:hypothetical protein